MARYIKNRLLRTITEQKSRAIGIGRAGCFLEIVDEINLPDTIPCLYFISEPDKGFVQARLRARHEAIEFSDLGLTCRIASLVYCVSDFTFDNDFRILFQHAWILSPGRWNAQGR